MKRALSALLCALLLVSAGCVAGTSGGPGAAPTTDEPTATPTETPTATIDTPVTHTGTVGTTRTTISESGSPPDLASDLGEPTQCGISSVAFYRPPNGWEPGTVSLGYMLDDDAGVMFVAFAGTETVGTELDWTDQAVAVDGNPLELDREVRGEWVAVVAMSDENGDGQYDADTDRPCGRDGEVVMTGWTWLG